MCPSVYVADNGVALDPSRRGCTGRLMKHVRSLGVEPITSKQPYHPTTQGKNERFGQSLFRYLDQQPLAASTVIAIWDTSTITFADPHGEVLIQYTWPPHGTTYVSHHPPDPTNQRGGRGRKRL